MKKVLLLFCLLLCSSGCSVKYHLDIDEVEKMTYQESIEIISEDYDEVSYFYESSFPYNAYDDELVPSESMERVQGVSYYEMTKMHDDNYHISFKFNFPKERFSHSTGIKSAYPYFKMITDKDTVTLDSGIFNSSKFSSVDSLEVSINVNREVLEHNADKVSGNIYTWIMNNDDISRRTMQLVYSLDSKEEVEESNNWANEHPLLLILITFASLFVGLGIVLFVYRKMR